MHTASVLKVKQEKAGEGKKMNGKDKCRILKEIRRQIAENNDIEWVVSECRHQGECKGTCPRCESEVRKLERELERRRRLGLTIAIAGISAACITGLTGCRSEIAGFNPFGQISRTEPYTEELEGEIAVIDEDPTEEIKTGEPDSGDIVDIGTVELSGDVALPEEGR